ncbi:unnamed protein product, partial [Closterium sp. NIES-53]
MDGFDDNPFATGEDAQPFVAGGGKKPAGTQFPVNPFSLPPETLVPVKKHTGTSASTRVTDARSTTNSSTADSARSSAIPEDWLDTWTGLSSSASTFTSTVTSTASTASRSTVNTFATSSPFATADAFGASNSSSATRLDGKRADNFPPSTTDALATGTFARGSDPQLQSQIDPLAAAQLAMGFLRAVQGASGVGGAMGASVAGRTGGAEQARPATSAATFPVSTSAAKVPISASATAAGAGAAGAAAAGAAAAGTKRDGTEATADPFAFLDNTPLGVTSSITPKDTSTSFSEQNQQKDDVFGFDPSPFVASSSPLFGSSTPILPPDPDLASDPFWTSISSQPPTVSSQHPSVLSQDPFNITPNSTLFHTGRTGSAQPPLMDLLGEPLVEPTNSTTDAAVAAASTATAGAVGAATAGAAAAAVGGTGPIARTELMRASAAAETAHDLTFLERFSASPVGAAATGPVASSTQESGASAAAAETAHDLTFLERFSASPVASKEEYSGFADVAGTAGATGAGVAGVAGGSAGGFDGFGDFSDLGLPAVVVHASAAAPASATAAPAAAATPGVSAAAEPLFPAFQTAYNSTPLQEAQQEGKWQDKRGEKREAKGEANGGVERNELGGRDKINDTDTSRAGDDDVTSIPVLASSSSPAAVVESKYISSLPPVEYYSPAGKLPRTIFDAPTRMPVDPNRPVPLVVCPKSRGEARAEVRAGEGRGREGGKASPSAAVSAPGASGFTSGFTTPPLPYSSQSVSSSLLSSSPPLSSLLAVPQSSSISASLSSSSDLSPMSSSSSLLPHLSSSSSLPSPSPATAATAAAEADAAAAAAAAEANLTGPDAGGKGCLLVAVGSVAVCVTDDGLRAWDMRQAMLPDAAGGEAKVGAIGEAKAGAAGAAKEGATGEYKAGAPGGFDTAVAAAADSEGVAPKNTEYSQLNRPLKPLSRLGSDAAPFVFVPFRGLAARAKSIASDDRLGVVFTGHKDGRVLVWRVLLTGRGTKGTKGGTGGGTGEDTGGGAGVTAAGGAKEFKRRLGIGLRDPGVQVALVADWQAHTATVTSLVVTPYGELWSAGDRGIIKAWSRLSLTNELHRTMHHLEEGLDEGREERRYRPIASDLQQQQLQNADVAGDPVPIRISPTCVELRQHRASSGSAAAEQARNDMGGVHDSSNLRGYGGISSSSNENRTSYDPATANAAAAATGGAGVGAAGSGSGAGAGNSTGTSPRALSPISESMSALTPPNVSTARGAVRVMVADAANGWVWTAGPASACIWDARKRELIRALSSLSDPSAYEEPSRSFPPRGNSAAASSGDVSIISSSTSTTTTSSSTFSNATGTGGVTRDRRMEGAWKLLAKSREVLGKAKGAVTDAVRAAAAAGKGEEYLSGGGGSGGIDDLDTSGSGGSNSTFSSPSPAVRVSGGTLRKLQAATAVGDGSVWFGFRSGALVRIDRSGARLQEVGLDAGVCCLCVVGLRLWVGMADGGIVVLGARNGRRLGGWPGVQKLSRKQQLQLQQQQYQQQQQQQFQQYQQQQQDEKERIRGQMLSEEGQVGFRRTEDSRNGESSGGNSRGISRESSEEGSSGVARMSGSQGISNLPAIRQLVPLTLGLVAQATTTATSCSSSGGTDSSSYSTTTTVGQFVLSVAKNGEVSAWPSAFPSPPLESALHAALAAQSQAFTKRRKLQVATGTWNVGEEKPDGETVQAWLGEVARGADVVAVGLQEVEMGARAIALAAAKESVGMGLQEKESGAAQEWTVVIRKALGAAGGSAGSSGGASAAASAASSSDPSSISAPSSSSSAAAACADDGFVRIASRQLAGMMLTVWVREYLLPDISDVETGAVACGFGRALGNKGGVGVRMTICGRICAIINCHLAAHDNATAKRNEDWHRIYTTMEFGRSMGTVGTAATNAAKAAG